ncbi:MAG: STAS domain-containing protein, partial [Pseudonocardia sp.]|nr:STAS domain-containing protein [Pseudonocardia sp.]
NPAPMNPALRCDVRRRYPVALVVVTGVLRLDTAHLLRAAALKVLADRPTALVVDLAGVDVADPAAATVLTLVEQHAAKEADAPVLLAAPSPSVRHELHRLGMGLDVHGTRADALSAAARRPVPSRVRLAFGADRDAPAAARHAVSRACERWGLGSALRDRATQVVNELVTNVVEHAWTDGTLLITRRHAHLHLAVRDGSREPPVPGSGFGLAVIDGLSSSWGVRTAPDGKVVWVTLRIWPATGVLPGQTGRTP